MPADFDRYAGNYDALLQDPLRDLFKQSGNFFHLRKWMLIKEYLDRERFQAGTSAWLDVGCGKGELLSIGAGSFTRAVGCDPSEEMARSALVEVRHQPCADVLPFSDSSF